MNADQIAVWAASGESETMEFKLTTGERREATATLCVSSAMVQEDLTTLKSLGLIRPEGHGRGATWHLQ